MSDLSRAEARQALEQHEAKRSGAEVAAQRLAMLMLLEKGSKQDEAEIAALIARYGAAASLSFILADGDRSRAWSSRRRAIGDEREDVVRRATQAAQEMTSKLASTARAIETRAESTPRQRTWAKSMGRTIATNVASRVAVEMAPIIADALGIQLHKTWISRGDERVRELHRQLHGESRQMDDAFWRQLGTKKVLRYPGDTKAPVDQYINCRCGLWLVPREEASLTKQVFQSEFDMPIAASAAEPALTIIHDALADYSWPA